MRGRYSSPSYPRQVLHGRPQPHFAGPPTILVPTFVRSAPDPCSASCVPSCRPRVRPAGSRVISGMSRDPLNASRVTVNASRVTVRVTYGTPRSSCARRPPSKRNVVNAAGQAVHSPSPMLPFILRKLLYSIPVYLGIVLLVMLCLRVNDPVTAYLGKNATPESIAAQKEKMGLSRPFLAQYAGLLGDTVTLSFEEKSWERPTQSVGQILGRSVWPSLMISIPGLIIVTFISVAVALLSAYVRGTLTDKVLMFGAILGMSVSILVYVVLGQYFGAYYPRQALGVSPFAISGYKPGAENWAYYCLLPVIIIVLLELGYDTRFYRAAMVEETSRDYIVTARAKGASKPKILFVHMLKNAMIPIITNVMITLPFLITGSIVIETYFQIPGMGYTLITAITSKDFPVIQAFTAVFAAIFILTNILTDVLYALVDPRVRLK